MNSKELKLRFRSFSIEVAKLIKGLPTNKINDAYARQLIRSSSSAGANYYAACRAKSSADFINKLKIVEEELDESMFFPGLILQFNADFNKVISKLTKEADELIRIVVQSIKTSRLKRKE